MDVQELKEALEAFIKDELPELQNGRLLQWKT